jgi:hypothetical protein
MFGFIYCCAKSGLGKGEMKKMFSWLCVDTVAQPETTQRKIALFTDCPFINISVMQNTFANNILPDWCRKAQQKGHSSGFKRKFNVGQM